MVAHPSPCLCSVSGAKDGLICGMLRKPVPGTWASGAPPAQAVRVRYQGEGGFLTSSMTAPFPCTWQSYTQHWLRVLQGRFGAEIRSISHLVTQHLDNNTIHSNTVIIRTCMNEAPDASGDMFEELDEWSPLWLVASRRLLQHSWCQTPLS